MKFINPKGVEFEYLESFSEVKRDSFPFGSIYEKEDLTGSKLVLDEEIPIENVFTLKVNVKRVGKVFFLFKLESLDKERLVEEVRKLKSIDPCSVQGMLYDRCQSMRDSAQTLRSWSGVLRSHRSHPSHR